jgi:enoyl-CoA hydratase
MADLVHYRLADGIATITLDDGKRNALSPEMFRQIYAALDRAEADRAVVILTGREQVFSAGFDLKVMRGAPLEALRMLRTRGDFRISANEVAIGMMMPRVAAAMLRHRLNPADFQTAVALAKYFAMDDALRAGFFDELADAVTLLPRAHELAAEFAKLDMPAHTASKRRIRGPLIRTIRRSVPLDLLDAAWVGVKTALRGRR